MIVSIIDLMIAIIRSIPGHQVRPSRLAARGCRFIMKLGSLVHPKALPYWGHYELTS